MSDHLLADRPSAQGRSVIEDGGRLWRVLLVVKQAESGTLERGLIEVEPFGPRSFSNE
jgi:hypothetical protein